MKIKHFIKKYLISSIIGFPTGVTLLMLSYICIYFFVGESIFNIEIKKLENINTLIFQIILSGLDYYLVFVSFHVFEELNNNETNNYYNLPRSIKLIIAITLLIILIIILPSKTVFNGTLSTMYILILILTYSIYNIYVIIKCAIEKIYIKKINAKIKEKNY